MKSITVRELQSPSADVWGMLAKEKDLVVRSNGEPVAVLSAVTASTLDAARAALRQARAQAAVAGMQRRAAEVGLDEWSPEDINAEINDSRREK